MYIDELVTPDNIDAVKDNLGDFGYVDEIEVGDVISVMECGDGFKIIVCVGKSI
jgi:dihydrodipicolinate synthase/N-acetylneuraminate lyase